MAAGDQVTKSPQTYGSDTRKLDLPPITGMADGTYNVALVISGGVPSFRFTVPIADATHTISGLTSFSTKDGVVTVKV